MHERRLIKRARTRAFMAAMLLGGVVWLQAASSASALPHVIAQVATPTPFRRPARAASRWNWRFRHWPVD
jgi:hypothetical protein